MYHLKQKNRVNVLFPINGYFADSQLEGQKAPWIPLYSLFPLAEEELMSSHFPFKEKYSVQSNIKTACIVQK